MFALATALSGLALLGGNWDTAQKLRAESHRAFLDSGADCYVRSLDYLDRLRAAGIPARIVIVQSTMTNLYDSHTFVEVNRAGRWVIQDPTFDGGWMLGGRLIGATEMQEALAQGRSQEVRWVGPQAAMRHYYVDPRVLFRNARYRTKNEDGKVVPARAPTVLRKLAPLYYAKSAETKPPTSRTGVIVVAGGSNWKYRGYAFARLPDGRWISPIIFLPANTDTIAPVGDGPRGRLEVRWVSPYR